MWWYAAAMVLAQGIWRVCSACCANCSWGRWDGKCVGKVGRRAFGGGWSGQPLGKVDIVLRACTREGTPLVTEKAMELVGCQQLQGDGTGQAGIVWSIAL